MVKTRRQVKCIVEDIAREKGALKQRNISNGWWTMFLKRNPMLRLGRSDSTAIQIQEAKTVG